MGLETNLLGRNWKKKCGKKKWMRRQRMVKRLEPSEKGMRDPIPKRNRL